MKRFELKIKEWENEKRKLESKRELLNIKKRKIGRQISTLNNKIYVYEKKYENSCEKFAKQE